MDAFGIIIIISFGVGFIIGVVIMDKIWKDYWKRIAQPMLDTISSLPCASCTERYK